MTLSEFVNKVIFQVDEASVERVNRTIRRIKESAGDLESLGALPLGQSGVSRDLETMLSAFRRVPEAAETARAALEDLKNAAKDAGADEAVFVRDGFVTEGSHTNIHMLKDGILYSHPADECILPGVTRGVLLKLCMRLGIPVSEKPFTVEQMRSADEVLISSSLLGVRTASAIDSAPVGGKAAETVGAIRDAYRNAFLKEFLR